MKHGIKLLLRPMICKYIDEGVVWGFSWLGATGRRFWNKTQKGPAECVYGVCVHSSPPPPLPAYLHQSKTRKQNKTLELLRIRRKWGNVNVTFLPYQVDNGNGSIVRFDKPRNCEGSDGCARRVTPPTTIIQSRLKSVNQFINQPIDQQPQQLNVRFPP